MKLEMRPGPPTLEPGKHRAEVREISLAGNPLELGLVIDLLSELQPTVSRAIAIPYNDGHLTIVLSLINALSDGEGDYESRLASLLRGETQPHRLEIDCKEPLPGYFYYSFDRLISQRVEVVPFEQRPVPLITPEMDPVPALTCAMETIIEYNSGVDLWNRFEIAIPTLHQLTGIQSMLIERSRFMDRYHTKIRKHHRIMGISARNHGRDQMKIRMSRAKAAGKPYLPKIKYVRAQLKALYIKNCDIHRIEGALGGKLIPIESIRRMS